MWNRKAAVSAVAVAALALAGACSDVPPTEPQGIGPDHTELFRRTAPDPSRSPHNIDAEFVRIAQEVPGFGGFFYDETGTLNVHMTGVQTLSTAQVASALRDRLVRLPIDASELQGMRVREARYDFIQLDAMHREATPVLSLPGVVFTDADEGANRVRIGVESSAAEAAVRDAIAMAGIPSEAVIIELTAPIVPESGHTLRDRIRPVAGGLSINFTRGASGFICTMGFNVRSPTVSGVHGFVTNSHCSDTRGVVIPTPYWQHSRFVEGTFIGHEAHDIPFFTGGMCPEGRRCRWSDALGGLYEAGVENAFGRIYRTTQPSPLPADTIWTIDPATPMWQIVDEHPFPVIGQELHKVGRRTGWTSGLVSATCVNSNTAPDITLFCQDRVATPSGGGDSGAPYFVRIGDTNSVALIGIHWGSGGTPPTTVLSSMSNIRFENEHPAGWITFPGQTPPPPSIR